MAMETCITFTASEGTYSLRDDLTVSSPAQAVPPVYPARLVTVTACFPPRTTPSRSREPSAQEVLTNTDEHLHDVSNVISPVAARTEIVSQLSKQTKVPTTGPSKRRALVALASLPPMPLAATASAGPDAKAASFTSRPRAALKGTTSSFVKGYDGLPLSSSTLKALAPPAGAAGEVDWIFWTCSRSVLWADIQQEKDVIAKLTFSATPTALAVARSATSERVDLLLGFSTGDILWLDPICARYTRLNKQGCTTTSPVTCLKWHPSTASPGIFASGHEDGSVVVWDRDREDGSFVVPHQPPRIPRRLPSSLHSSTSHQQSMTDLHTEPAEDIVVTTPAPPTMDRRGKTSASANPLSHWWISRRALTDLAFSPDGQYCAVTSEDGTLRIIDVTWERLLDAYGSYFGGLTSVAWSADGRFCATGGEDDLVCIYAPLEQRVVARCQGHGSFVAGVAFDAQKSDDRTSRLASVGDDKRLIFVRSSPS